MQKISSGVDSTILMMSICPASSGESASSVFGRRPAAEGGVYPAVIQKQPMAALLKTGPQRFAVCGHSPSNPVRPGVRDAAVGPQPEGGGA